jgi:hypothetical protein
LLLLRSRSPSERDVAAKLAKDFHSSLQGAKMPTSLLVRRPNLAENETTRGNWNVFLVNVALVAAMISLGSGSSINAFDLCAGDYTALLLGP